MDLLLNYSKKVVFLTGAGCSTSAGIPDYRGLGKPSGEKSARQLDLTLYKPTKVHNLIADFVNSGKVRHLLTQNIDDLHRDVHPDKLSEIHGNHSKGRCHSCGTVMSWTGHKSCPCGGRLTQTVVDFDTSVDPVMFKAAEKIVDDADLLIIMGTSLKVTPFNLLPGRMLKRGGNIIMVNRDPTEIDPAARMVYRCDIYDFLEDMERVYNKESPKVKPYAIRELPKWDNTIKVWSCDFCTTENRFYPDCCEACGSACPGS